MGSHGKYTLSPRAIVITEPLTSYKQYSVSKAAMAMLSRCMRVEFGPLGVTVIHVVTGGVRTTTAMSTVDFELPPTSVYSPAKAEMEPFLRASAELELMSCEMSPSPPHETRQQHSNERRPEREVRKKGCGQLPEIFAKFATVDRSYNIFRSRIVNKR